MPVGWGKKLMYSQKELVRRYFDGAETGVASNMEIAVTVGDGVVIQGYGHAVYAYRPPDGRFGPVCFTGWYGASKSTDQHLGMIEPECEDGLDGRPGMGDVRGDPDFEVLAGISSNDKEYGGYHKKRNRR